MSNQKVSEVLKADLLAARKSRDRLKIETLQSTLSRITNAEAMPVGDTHDTYRVSVGVGSTEVTRRVLSEQDVIQTIQDEINELQDAIAGMGAYPDNQYIATLREKVSILEPYVSSSIV
jgi:uncharacterized protein